LFSLLEAQKLRRLAVMYLWFPVKVAIPDLVLWQ